jgi:hypothetical protein
MIVTSLWTARDYFYLKDNDLGRYGCAKEIEEKLP